jgi:hypothetical protein
MKRCCVGLCDDRGWQMTTKSQTFDWLFTSWMFFYRFQVLKQPRSEVELATKWKFAENQLSSRRKIKTTKIKSFISLSKAGKLMVVLCKKSFSLLLFRPHVGQSLISLLWSFVLKSLLKWMLVFREYKELILIKLLTVFWMFWRSHFCMMKTKEKLIFKGVFEI